jgi:hypothetical protein
MLGLKMGLFTNMPFILAVFITLVFPALGFPIDLNFTLTAPVARLSFDSLAASDKALSAVPDSLIGDDFDPHACNGHPKSPLGDPKITIWCVKTESHVDCCVTYVSTIDLTKLTWPNCRKLGRKVMRCPFPTRPNDESNFFWIGAPRGYKSIWMERHFKYGSSLSFTSDE